MTTQIEHELYIQTECVHCHAIHDYLFIPQFTAPNGFTIKNVETKCHSCKRWFFTMNPTLHERKATSFYPYEYLDNTNVRWQNETATK